MLIGVISTAIGLLNLFPIPVLDGGPGGKDVVPIFPLALDGDTWHSEWSLWNATAAELVTKLVFHGDGRTIYFPFE